MVYPTEGIGGELYTTQLTLGWVKLNIYCMSPSGDTQVTSALANVSRKY